MSTQRTRVLSPGEIAGIPAGRGLHLDGTGWELVTLTAAHRDEPWRTLTTPGRIMTTTESVPSDRPSVAFRGRDVLGRVGTSCPQHCQCVECMPGSVGDGRGGSRGSGVLIVAKITKGTAGGYAEYLEGKARASELGDYYLKDGERVEAPGRWAGGAHLFGHGRQRGRDG